jgi:N-acetylneuraminic acid mutarotase
MRLTNLNLKHILAPAATVFVIGLCLALASCNGSTSTTTTGSWDVGSELNGLPRSGAVSFVIDNKAYIGGGYNYDNDKRIVDFWVYDPDKKNWTQVDNFPGTARNAAVAFVLNGKGYVGTGYDGTNYLGDFYQFDPTQAAGSQWTKIANFGGTARYGCYSFTVGNRAFVGSGYDGSAQKDLWEYIPGEDTWQARTGISGGKRVNAFSFVIDQTAYVGGGSNNGSYQRDFFKYDATSDSWTALDALDQKDINGNAETEPRTRELATTFVIDGFAYLTCGSIGSALGDTWQYNPVTDDWVQYNSLNTSTTGASARDSAVGFTLTVSSGATPGVFGFIVTGKNGNQRYDDMWFFNPLIQQVTVI